jgi:hypothetical protein
LQNDTVNEFGSSENARTGNDCRIAPADRNLANGLMSGERIDGQRFRLRESNTISIINGKLGR